MLPYSEAAFFYWWVCRWADSAVAVGVQDMAREEFSFRVRVKTALNVTLWAGKHACSMLLHCLQPGMYAASMEFYSFMMPLRYACVCCRTTTYKEAVSVVADSHRGPVVAAVVLFRVIMLTTLAE